MMGSELVSNGVLPWEKTQVLLAILMPWERIAELLCTRHHCSTLLWLFSILHVKGDPKHVHHTGHSDLHFMAAL